MAKMYRLNVMDDLIGVDGCADGWICLYERQNTLIGRVFGAFDELLQWVPIGAIVTIDVPIGLTEKGPRMCDLEARRFLKRPRRSSVFPAPVRAALVGGTYENVCEVHYRADGR